MVTLQRVQEEIWTQEVVSFGYSKRAGRIIGNFITHMLRGRCWANNYVSPCRMTCAGAKAELRFSRFSSAASAVVRLRGRLGLRLRLRFFPVTSPQSACK